MANNTQRLKDFDEELAAEERAHDEAYGEARDAWYNAKVLGGYKRAQNVRLVNAYAKRLLKSYVPKQRKVDE